MALVLLCVVTYLAYTISEQSLRAEVTNTLCAIADNKGTSGSIEEKRRLQFLSATIVGLPAG